MRSFATLPQAPALQIYTMRSEFSKCVVMERHGGIFQHSYRKRGCSWRPLSTSKLHSASASAAGTLVEGFVVDVDSRSYVAKADC